MSYLDFYDLEKQPFHVTPDPEFLFLSPSHKEALGTFLYGISKRKGILAVIGEVGVGKTTILRSYLEKVDADQVKLIYLFNANIPFVDLVRTLCDELGVGSESHHVPDLVNDLHIALIREYGAGRNVVLIIDEAQNIPFDTLENLRMLSNLETKKDKLLQIVLIGQPELEQKLNEYRLRQLRQRIAVRSTIVPLTQVESVEYIESRLKKCGLPSGSMVFSPPALKTIVKTADGIPRVINILCDNALITGYAYQQKPIRKAVIKEVVADFYGQPQSHYRPWAISTVLIILVSALIWFMLRDHLEAISATGTGDKFANTEPVVSGKPHSVAGAAAIATAMPPKADTPVILMDSPETEQTLQKKEPKQTKIEKPKKLQQKLHRVAAPRETEDARKRREARAAVERSRKIQLLLQDLTRKSPKPKTTSSLQSFPIGPLVESSPQKAESTPDTVNRVEIEHAELQEQQQVEPEARQPAPALEETSEVQETGEKPKDVEPEPPTRSPEPVSAQSTDVYSPPSILRTVKPAYPRSGLMARREGTVFMKVLVTERGTVEAVQILRGIAGDQSFADAAAAAVKRWDFAPGVKNGIRQKMWLTCSVSFHLA